MDAEKHFPPKRRFSTRRPIHHPRDLPTAVPYGLKIDLAKHTLADGRFIWTVTDDTLARIKKHGCTTFSPSNMGRAYSISVTKRWAGDIHVAGDLATLFERKAVWVGQLDWD